MDKKFIADINTNTWESSDLLFVWTSMS